MRTTQAVVRIGCLALLAGACTTIQVTPLRSTPPPDHVCILENRKTRVPEFVEVLRDLFAAHRISTAVITTSLPPECEFVLTYSAERSWDVGFYLSHAELHLHQGNREVASAVFHLRGEGGFALTKYRKTKSKMGPIVQELLGLAPVTDSSC